VRKSATEEGRLLWTAPNRA